MTTISLKSSRENVEDDEAFGARKSGPNQGKKRAKRAEKERKKEDERATFAPPPLFERG